MGLEWTYQIWRHVPVILCMEFVPKYSQEVCMKVIKWSHHDQSRASSRDHKTYIVRSLSHPDLGMSILWVSICIVQASEKFWTALLPICLPLTKIAYTRGWSVVEGGTQGDPWLSSPSKPCHHHKINLMCVLEASWYSPLSSKSVSGRSVLEKTVCFSITLVVGSS